MPFQRDVIAKLNAIAEKQAEHTTQLAVNTKILDDHHKRTTLLEERFKPIEHNVVFTNKLAKVIAALVTMSAGVATIVQLLAKH